MPSPIAGPSPVAIDITEKVGTIEAAVTQAEAWAADAKFVLAAPEDPRLAAAQPCKFLDAMGTANNSNYPVLTRQTYQELISTGGLNLLRDDMLKRKIGRYYADFDQNGQYTEQFRLMALGYSDAIRGVRTIKDLRVLRDPDADACGITASEALAVRVRFLARDGAVDWLPTLETRQRGFADRLRQSLDSARELQARLQQTMTTGKTDRSTN